MGCYPSNGNGDTVNQRDKVLSMLLVGPVCSTDFLRAFIPRAGARIYELRQAGYMIGTRPCQFSHHDHDTHQIVYELETIDQRSLF